MSGSAVQWGLLIGALLAFLWLDLHFFARGRQPSFREGAIWSIGWLAISLAAAVVLLVAEGGDRAINYTTVYLIERSLSLDNLFVFILLFTYFGVPVELRARLLFFGIVFALVLRGLAILGGLAAAMLLAPPTSRAAETAAVASVVRSLGMVSSWARVRART